MRGEGSEVGKMVVGAMIGRTTNVVARYIGRVTKGGRERGRKREGVR